MALDRAARRKRRLTWRGIPNAAHIHTASDEQFALRNPNGFPTSFALGGGKRKFVVPPSGGGLSQAA
jgi:hypothetical protein